MIHKGAHMYMYICPEKFRENTKGMVCRDHPGTVRLGNGTCGKGKFPQYVLSA